MCQAVALGWRLVVARGWKEGVGEGQQGPRGKEEAVVRGAGTIALRQLSCLGSGQEPSRPQDLPLLRAWSSSPLSPQAVTMGDTSRSLAFSSCSPLGSRWAQTFSFPRPPTAPRPALSTPPFSLMPVLFLKYTLDPITPCFGIVDGCPIAHKLKFKLCLKPFKAF